jgi:hypothetical protein
MESLSWPEASGISAEPLKQHKKVRCYSENVKLGDDRNYEIEKIRKDVRKYLCSTLAEHGYVARLKAQSSSK